MRRINFGKLGVVALGIGLMALGAPQVMAQENPDGQNAASNEAGSIDTSQPMAGTTTTTTTTVTQGEDFQAVDAEPLPNTGGEPLLFMLAGSALIAGGWAWRCKMATSK